VQVRKPVIDAQTLATVATNAMCRNGGVGQVVEPAALIEPTGLIEPTALIESLAIHPAAPL
jgi:hypothetical protein